MWTVFVFLNLGLLHCTVSSSLPSPINVVFSSVNLRNILHWSPGNDTPEDTNFTVQYAIYGDSVEGSKGRRVNWRAVRRCTDIVRSWCDLSNETWDLEQGYHARVRAAFGRASSKWALTHRRFDPKLDVTFGPPLVTVEIEGNDAVITLTGPMRYQPDNHTPVVSLATVYPQMTYNLSIHNARRGQTHHIPVVSGLYKHQLMDYETEYCFSAKTRFLSMPVQCQSSAWHCITTPQDPMTGHLQRVVWGIVVPSLCICALMVIGYFLRNYLMGNGQKSPDTLSPTFFQPSHQPFPPEELNFIFISVIKDESPSDTDSAISDPEFPAWQQRIVNPPPAYSPQRPETPSEPDDLSVDYGVVVASKMNVGGEEGPGERRHDREEDGNNLRGKCQKCTAGESYEQKALRVEDGFAGVYASQAKSFLSQRSTRTCMQTHLPIHSQTEMSTLLQAQAFSQSKSVLLTQTQGSLLSFQGATKGEVDREEEDGECPGLFLNKKNQTGLFHVPLNLQTKKHVGKWEEMDRTDDEKTDGAVEEGRESEKVSLLSPYASQNFPDIPTSNTDQSDFLPDDYGVLSLATAHSIEEEGDEGEEQEEGTICVNWDPETRKLVLSEMAMEFNENGGLDGLIQRKEGSEDRMGGEEEEVNAVKGELKLENVFVRQASEEETEAQRETERGGETGWEANDILSKWNLVISVDE
ncbi:interleukin-20 receptor subunit alpha [Toxotes jaculatrix]|uniref:interleukin-20 receptor subunit alpha n=1 Tax=Toxotes jaculatrix TaxID=941984 RepID=UPI001B3AD3AE|nr:interleukin-20 receptor subunit alpha [Toxotes jaculatrix]